MFDPSQFDYTDLEIEQASAENRLLSLEIEFNRQCNYRCPYCYAVTTENMCTDYDPQVIDTAVQQAAELGARKIVILGREPLLLRNLKEKVEDNRARHGRRNFYQWLDYDSGTGVFPVRQRLPGSGETQYSKSGSTHASPAPKIPGKFPATLAPQRTASPPDALCKHRHLDGKHR